MSLTYKDLVARNSNLLKEVRKGNLLIDSLKNLTKVQDQVIGQIKSVMIQPRPTCAFKHHWCHIDHQKYYYVRPIGQYVKQWPVKFKSESRIRNKAPMQHQIGNTSFNKLFKKINELQSFYGVPPIIPAGFSK